MQSLPVRRNKPPARLGPLLSLGGDHAATFPLVEGLVRVHGPLNLLRFDAHPDLYHDYGGNPRSRASPFVRIMERGLARRLVQVGVRTWNAHNRVQAERFGVELNPALDVGDATGIVAVKILKELAGAMGRS